MRTTFRRAVGVTAATLLAAGLAACSTGGSEAEGPVTITVADRPTDDRPEDQAYFDERVEAFEKANPDIDIEAVETVWDAQTFQAMAASGELPDVMGVPYTEPQGLIERQQIADISDALEESGLLDKLNPTTLSVVTGADGGVYGVPTAAYSIGLVYNRDLFTQAGLDPDSPPATWDEVREAAKRITDSTDAAGYAQAGSGNQGGWIATALTYSYGGTVENEAGDEVTFDEGATQAALETIQEMRWTDGSVAENALYTLNDLAQDFAAGEIGMYVAAPDAYWSLVQNYALDPAVFGVGPMPQDGGENGTLAGGGVRVVSPSATEEEKAAAVAWIQFNYLEKFFDEELAVADAKSAVEAGALIGIRGLPVVSTEQDALYYEWIADYLNVPQENFAPYLEAVDDMPIVPEPPNSAQELYAALDPVVQAVLSDPAADIETLLADAAETVQSQLSR